MAPPRLPRFGTRAMARPAPRKSLPGRAALAALMLVGALPGATPMAQTGLLEGRAASDEPVTFTAEEVEYDQQTDTVIARGRVEAFQGLRVLRAETFTYNRTTGVATASGNVTLIEPDGQVLFADSAELRGGMREAALEGLRGLMAANGRVAAAGARRTPIPDTEQSITDLARVVYSTCDTCPQDPDSPPLWQIRARIASHHPEDQRIRYRDATLQMWGLPLLYAPYFSHASPEAQRASGFLSPSFGYTRFLGAFAEIPYYWAIDDHSDATLTTTLSSGELPNLGGIYRRRFNSGDIILEGSIGHLGGDNGDEGKGIGGHILARGAFNLDENWRTGFTLNRASSREYLRTFRLGAPRYLYSTAFVEGFWGAEGYARLDGRYYQPTTRIDDTGTIPAVLPYGYADYAFARDNWGGFATLDAQAYAVTRGSGTDTRRLGTRATYELPWAGAWGDLWTARAQADLLGGWTTAIEQSPFFGDPGDNGTWTRGNFRAALDWRQPLVRPAGDWGSQLIEPRVQFVTGPAMGRQLAFPNEDSLSFEFTDANLFALNRFYGRDRQEGGSRVDAALRGAWLFPNGGQLEGLVGRSLRFQTDEVFAPGTGLEGRSSDWVARARLAPVPWFELLGRTRLDRETGEPRLWDASATAQLGRFSVTGGYLSAPPVPGTSRKREDISAGFSTRITDTWRVGVFTRYDIANDQRVSGLVNLTYEDECFVFEMRFIRSRELGLLTTEQTEDLGTALLFRLSFKTVGDFGFRAL